MRNDLTGQAGKHKISRITSITWSVKKNWGQSLNCEKK